MILNIITCSKNNVFDPIFSSAGKFLKVSQSKVFQKTAIDLKNFQRKIILCKETICIQWGI